jgi:hypothetical protein
VFLCSRTNVNKTLVHKELHANTQPYRIWIISQSGKRLFVVIYASVYRLVLVIVDGKPDILKPG